MNDVVRIINIIQETYDTKTFIFSWSKDVIPGQFVMVWIPGIDEIPMSISGITKTFKSITVKAIGEATKKIHELLIGDYINIRGPYGNGFSIGSKNVLIVGGGIGTAAVMPVIAITGADTIIAARSSKEVIMSKVASDLVSNLWIATDDGSRGFHGNAVQLIKNKLKEKKYDYLIACGPEAMLFYTYKTCEEFGIRCQLSLERYIKCGVGLCGCCVIGGLRVCRDGPVFNNETIPKLFEFGIYKRDECGRLVRFG